MPNTVYNVGKGHMSITKKEDQLCQEEMVQDQQDVVQ